MTWPTTVTSERKKPMQRHIRGHTQLICSFPICSSFNVSEQTNQQNFRQRWRYERWEVGANPHVVWYGSTSIIHQPPSHHMVRCRHNPMVPPWALKRYRTCCLDPPVNARWRGGRWHHSGEDVQGQKCCDTWPVLKAKLKILGARHPLRQESVHLGKTSTFVAVGQGPESKGACIA